MADIRRRGNVEPRVSSSGKVKYRARVTETEKNALGESSYKKISLGTYKTKKEANDAIRQYELEKTNPSCNKTYYEVLVEWAKSIDKLHGFIDEDGNIVQGKKDTPTIRTERMACRYSTVLMQLKKPISEITPSDIYKAVVNAYYKDAKGNRKDASAVTKQRVKSQMNRVFDYAIKEGYVDSNPARSINVTTIYSGVKNANDKNISIVEEAKRNKRERRTLSDNIVRKIEEARDVVEANQIYFDMVLIQLYTGMRAKELASLPLNRVDFENNIIKWGMKTDAGKDRIIPIHSKILPIIKSRAEKTRQYLAVNNRDVTDSTPLFYHTEGQANTNMTYDKYRHGFELVMKLVGENREEDRPQRKEKWYTTHDVRSTFVTKAFESRMAIDVIKKIAGHVIPVELDSSRADAVKALMNGVDVTIDIYDKPNIERLHEEIEKIKY